MRRISVLVILFLVAVPSLGQADAQLQVQRQPPAFQNRCCPRVYDAKGKLLGEIIRWDDRFPSIALQAYVRYPMAGGDVALIVAPESISGVQMPGGSVALFTTPDCSGNTMFAMLSWPPLMKRYAMVLPVAPNPGMVGIGSTNAWLFVTSPLPLRVSPGATLFRSQWGEGGACVPYPPPYYTVSPSPFGGYWMTRVEDLYTKFSRPFYSE